MNSSNNNNNKIMPKKMNQTVFLPMTPIRVSITAHRPNILYPYEYTLTFTHGPANRWSVARTYKQIRAVHRKLKRITQTTMAQKQVSQIPADWPLFPLENDHLITWALIDERCHRLAEYLERALAYPPFRDHPAMLSLLGVSYLSFAPGLGPSIKEGWLRKWSRDFVYYGPMTPTRYFCDKVFIYF